MTKSSLFLLSVTHNTPHLFDVTAEWQTGKPQFFTLNQSATQRRHCSGPEKCLALSTYLLSAIILTLLNLKPTRQSDEAAEPDPEDVIWGKGSAPLPSVVPS